MFSVMLDILYMEHMMHTGYIYRKAIQLVVVKIKTNSAHCAFKATV